MGIERDVLGFRYDDAEPAFVELDGGFYYHIRHPKKKYEKAAFDAWMVAEGLSFGANELGVPSLDYLREHETILWSFIVPGSADVDAEVTKIPSGADDTGQITISGGPTGRFMTLTVVMQDSTSAEPSTVEVTLDPRLASTPTEIAEVLAAHPANDPNFTSVTSALGVVTYTPSSGGSIDVLSVTLVPAFG